MKYLKTFESLEEKEKFERKPRPIREPQKRCLGQCDRKVILKDGKPAIYCAGCDRYVKSL
jgi:hypothetical protein